MGQRQPNRGLRHMLRLTVLCLTACLVLACGVTFARYQTEFETKSYSFVADRGAIFVYGGALYPDSETGVTSFYTNQARWSVVNDSAQMNFFVTNGPAADQFSARDQKCSVQLITGIGVEQTDENGTAPRLSLILTYQNIAGEQVSVFAVPEPIAPGSYLYKSYGAGWLYRFRDESGNELLFDLKGGKFSFQNFTITASGTAEPSLLELKISGEHAIH